MAVEAGSIAVILAGGRSRRMGEDKSLVPLAGKPVIAHVLERVRVQADRVVLNANGDLNRYKQFGLQAIEDDDEFFGDGPLAGILAVLKFAANERATHLLTVPCDAPFLPNNLAFQLFQSGRPGEIRVAASERGLEPLFALWPVALSGEAKALLRGGIHKMQVVVKGLPHHVVDFVAPPEGPDPFFNLNQPDDLAQATRWLTKN